MTSREDWEFRAQVLRDAAKRQREESERLIGQAVSLEDLARACEALAHSPQEHKDV
jgi:hypothetical protein